MSAITEGAHCQTRNRQFRQRALFGGGVDGRSMLNIGKITGNILKRSVLRQVSYKREEVFHGAGVGCDCAMLSFSPEEKMASCLQEAVLEREGDLALLIGRCANSLAAGGALPTAALLGLMLPEGTEEEGLKAWMQEAENACQSLRMPEGVCRDLGTSGDADQSLEGPEGINRNLERPGDADWDPRRSGSVCPAGSISEKTSRSPGIQIAGGHSGVSRAVRQPIASVTVLGRLRRVLPGASPGQDIVISKWVGLEGTALLADRLGDEIRTRYPAYLVEEAREFRRYQSVLPEAAIAVQVGVCAMHDASEGGILAALWELAEGWKLGFDIDLRRIPLRQETVEICEFFRINPYELLSGGSLLMVTEKGEELVHALEEAGIPARILGRTTEGPGRILRNEDEIRFLNRPGTDEIYKILGADNSAKAQGEGDFEKAQEIDEPAGILRIDRVTKELENKQEA